MNGVDLIRKERQRQRARSRRGEAYSLGHDDGHDEGELARAAAWYAMGEKWRLRVGDINLWPMFWRFKRTPDDRIAELVKAGALIAAEIDRLLREDSK